MLIVLKRSIFFARQYKCSELYPELLDVSGRAFHKGWDHSVLPGMPTSEYLKV